MVAPFALTAPHTTPRPWAYPCFTVLLAGLSLGACSSTQPTQSSTPASTTHAVGIDGLACMLNRVDSLPGATAVDDPAILAQAMGASLKGGICAGKAFKIERPLQVYRLWDGSVATSQYGSWWALSRPSGSRDTYRQDYGICPNWSALNRLTVCTVKPGTVIVIGSTQSVQCDDGSYGVSPSSQVFIKNNAATGLLAVENCQDQGAWP
jgi:hypothetical protein